MGHKDESEKTKLVSEPGVPCCMNCPEALRIEWRLLPYKAQYFFFYGAVASLLPFLSVYFKQLGLSATQIGIIFGMKPIFGTMAAPLWGAIGDKFRIRKGVLLFSIVMMTATFLTIGHLPPPTEAKSCPQGLPPVTNASGIESDLIHGYKLVFRWIYVENDVTHLFTLLVVCIIFGEFFWSPTGSMADAALLSALEESEMYKYPQQRSWGALGTAILQLGTGAALESTIHYKEICGLNMSFTNYKVAIYITTAALAVTLIISSFFKFRYDSNNMKQVKSAEEKMSEVSNGAESSVLAVIENEDGDHTRGSIQTSGAVKLRRSKFSLQKFVRLMCSVHYGSWLMCITYMGICNGLILNLLFLYLEDLGGDSLLMGVAGGVASGTEFLFYYVSFWFIDKLGPINMLYVSLITYALRFTNYALMVNPWLVLPSEVLQGFTFAAGWAAFVQHASDALPTSYLAAIMGMLHGVYWGLGIGCGNLIGGVLIDVIGARNMFRMFIGVTVAVTVLFCLAQQLSVKPVYVYDDDEEEEVTVKTD